MSADDTKSTRRLDGRSAVVTGGASGFGRAIVERLVRSGATVTMVDVSPGAAAVVAEIDGGAGVVELAVADVSQPEQVDAAFRRAHERYGRLDIAVNCAGVLGGGWIHEDGATAHLRRQLDINVIGVWNGCRTALELMRPQGHGCIVNISSPAAQVPTPGAVAYGLCKSAVLHLTQSLALGYAPDQVRVNAVLPDPALTGIFQVAGAARDELERTYLANIPLGRLAEVDDIAAAVEYLVSDDASFVTGAALNVDGCFRPRLPPRVLS